MKKIYAILGMSFLLIQGGRSFAQTTFQLFAPDTVAYSDTVSWGDIELHDGNYLKNKTANDITFDVVRVQNVGGTWTSAFCLNVCFADFIDSVQYTLPANDSIAFIPHFYIDATPDSQSIYMKFKNVNVPTDVVYQRFYGITKIGYGAGVHEAATNLSNVSVYPSPVVAGNDFNMNVTNVKAQSTEFSLVVYNMYGSVVATVNNLKENNNTLNLNLATGIYTYSLLAGNTRINTGEFSVVK